MATNEGISIGINIVFYYRLTDNILPNVYNKYNTNYGQLIVNMARSIIKNVASQYEVNDFITSHLEIGLHIANDLNQTIYKNVGIEVLSGNVFILNVIPPVSVTSQNLLSAIALQDNSAQMNQQIVDNIIATTANMVNLINANTSLAIQNANSEAIRIIENSKAQATNIILNAKADAIYNAVALLNITSAEGIRKFTELITMIDAKPKIVMSDGHSTTSFLRFNN